MLLQIANIQFAGEAHQIFAEIERGLFAIEESQARNQGGRNDERGVGELEGISDEQAGTLFPDQLEPFETAARRGRGEDLDGYLSPSR